GTPIRIAHTGSSGRGTGARTVAVLLTLTELTSYFPSDDVRHALVVQIERILAARQTPGDRVGRNSNHAAITTELYAAIKGAAFERNGGPRWRKDTGAGVAHLDCPVDQASLAADFFCADD